MAAAGAGDEMALSEFVMSHDIIHNFCTIRKLKNGQYFFINQNNSNVTPLSGFSTPNATDLDGYDAAAYILDHNSDGYPRLSRDIMANHSAALMSTDEAANWDLENTHKYFSYGTQTFSRLSDRRTVSHAYGTSILGDEGIIDVLGNGMLRETGTGTVISGSVFLPKVETPSYIIYLAQADWNNKTAVAMHVYNKSGTKLWATGLRVSNTYDYSLANIRELENGDILTFGASIGGICYLNSSGTKVWSHHADNTNFYANGFVEDDDYLYFHNGSDWTRFQRTNGTKTTSNTYPPTHGHFHVGTLYGNVNRGTPNGNATCLSKDPSGNIYSTGLDNKTGTIYKITNGNNLEKFFDIYDANNTYTYSCVTSCVYTEGKLLFNVIFQDSYGRSNNIVQAAITGSFDPTITSTLSAKLHTRLDYSSANTDGQIDLRIEPVTLNQAMNWQSSTANNGNFDTDTFTNWNGVNLKNDYDTNSNEARTTYNGTAGSMKLL